MKIKVITSLLVSYQFVIDNKPGFGDCTIKLNKPTVNLELTEDFIEMIRDAIKAKHISSNVSIVILNIISLYTNV